MVSHAGSQEEGSSHIGSVIGDRYRIDGLLDEGAMGRVYLGEHIHMRKRVAIKVLRRELTRVPEVLGRFEREAMAAAHIEHPNVAGATDFGKLEDGSVYLVLEYVEGRTLRKELKREAFSVPRALYVGRQIASALSAAHALEIVHRDLKPENVMLLTRSGGSNFVKVLDFGVAKVPIDMAQAEVSSDRASSDSAITRAGMVFGTPDYMAPEQALGQAVDARADLYSLGIVLYEMISGSRPFRADHELGVLGQQLATEPPSFKQRDPNLDVPAEVENLILRLLAREPSKRPQTAAEVVALLDARLEAMGESLEKWATTPDRNPPGTDTYLDTQIMSSAVKPWPVAASAGLPARLSERVRSVLPKPLKGAPAWTVLLLPVGGLVAIALLLMTFTASPDELDTVTDEPQKTDLGAAHSASTAETSPAPLTEAQVDAAIEAGELAINALLERYPNQALSHLAQARAAQKAKDQAVAVASVKRALELDPRVADSPHVASILWWGVQKSDTEEQVFALLKGPMKAKGADIMFDLASTPKLPDRISQQAQAWLRTRDFERVSTPEAAVAGALLNAENCEVRRALLKRSENVGGDRAARVLETFAKGEGCHKGEDSPCHACLDKKALTRTIKVIRRRLAESNANPSRPKVERQP